MEEEIQKLGSLSIRSEECVCLDEGDEAWEASNEDSSFSLIGRVFTRRSVSFDALFQVIPRAMSLVKGVKCSRVGTDIFLLKFNHKLDFQRAIEGSPWTFDKYPLILSPINEEEDLATMSLDVCDFFLHVHGLPYNKRTVPMAEFIGNNIRIYRDVDFDQSGKARADTLRIRVGINMNIPLKRCLKVRSSNGFDQ